MRNPPSQFNSNLAKFIVNHCFRNQGLIEDLHAAGHITQEQMKQLNISAVNRVAAVIHFIYESDLEDIFCDAIYQRDPLPEWDDATPKAEDDVVEVFLALSKHVAMTGTDEEDRDRLILEAAELGGNIDFFPDDPTDEELKAGIEFIKSVDIRVEAADLMPQPGESPPQHWTITVHGWGTCYFLGTEAQAEEWRKHKANWERAVAKKRPSTPEEIEREKFRSAEELLG